MQVNVLHAICAYKRTLILPKIQMSKHVTPVQTDFLSRLQRKMIVYEFVSHFSHDVTSLRARGGSRN